MHATLPAETRRAGFTLIELLVVIGVMLFLFGLTVAFMPAIYQRTEATRGAQQIQSYLAQARQRARRDRLATGVRFFNDGSDAKVTGRFLNKMVFIQQQADITGTEKGSGSGSGATLKAPGRMSNVVTISNINLAGVKRGDFLQINGGGVPHITIDPSDDTFKGYTNGGQLKLGSQLPYEIRETREFRIFRQPEELQGENAQRLPAKIGIDIVFSSVDGESDLISAATQKADPNAMRIVSSKHPASGYPFWDIVFAPGGGLYNSFYGTDRLVFFVRDYTDPDATKGGSPALVAVQVRTGFLAVHPAPVGNPYRSDFGEDFHKQTTSSGL